MMKINLIIISLILAVFYTVNGQSKHNVDFDIDSTEIKAIALSDIDFKFKIVINNHLKEQNQRLQFMKNKNKLIVIILDHITLINKPENKVGIDSLNIFSKFKDDDFEPSYRLLVKTINNTRPIIKSLQRYHKYFYYEYKSWVILFVTNLNIEFKNQSATINLKYFYRTNEIDKSEDYFNSVYDLSNFEVQELILKRLYYLSSDVVKSKKCKGVYWSNQKEYKFDF